MKRQFLYTTLAALAVLASGAINSARADLTSAGLSSWSITGDYGDVLALNGITVASGQLMTGTTLFYDGTGTVIDPSAPYEPAVNADDFSIGTTASADAKAYEITMFPTWTTTIFFLEKNGNDPSIYQGLDAAGNPIGASVFVNAPGPNWVNTGYYNNDANSRITPPNPSSVSQLTYGMVLTSDVPIYGFMVTGANSSGVPQTTSGIDPVSIIAVVPEPTTLGLLGLGLLMLLPRKR
jgi:PEP-CTERM motif